MKKMINRIGKKAIETYRQAAETTGNFAHQIRLKAVMADNKSEIKELYEEIGKQVYEKYLLKENMDIEKDFIKECSIINILADEIEDIRMELLSLKDLKQCPKCHYEIALGFNYCPICGKSQEVSPECRRKNANVILETVEDGTLKRKSSSTNQNEYYEDSEEESDNKNNLVDDE